MTEIILDLPAILEAHRKWLRVEEGGSRADLSGTDLSSANLRDAVLSRADLRRADLRRAVLRGAVLRGADLRGADLRGADLSDAVLSDADLSGADLIGAVLRGADLSGADLRGATLRGATLSRAVLSRAVLSGFDVPVVPNLDQRVLEAVIASDDALNMVNWHTCDTTHCRAGWHIHLAGEAGYKLEQKFGSAAAGALIYAASVPGKPIPNFYARHEEAMDDIRARAADTAA